MYTVINMGGGIRAKRQKLNCKFKKLQFNSLYRSKNWRDERHNRNEEYIEDYVPGDYVNEGGGIN